MIEPMKSGCESHEKEYLDNKELAISNLRFARHFCFSLASDMMRFATTHGFEGCGDNK